MNTQNTNQVMLSTYIRSAGNQLGCYFTFEFFRSNNTASILEEMHSKIPTEEGITNLNLLIIKLQRDMPEFRIYKDENNSNIIHFVDIRLLKIKSYSLDRKISLTYTGPLGQGRAEGGLVLELSKHVSEIRPKQGGAIQSSDSFDDHFTEVSVKSEAQSVRRVITDCLPLQNRSPFLWKAVTNMDGEKYFTSIQFYPPLKKS